MSLKNEIVISITGDGSREIRTIQKLTGKHLNEVDVVVAALRMYSWTLAQQAAGGKVVAEFPMKSRFKGVEVTGLLQNKKAAARHYRKYGVWPSKKSKINNKNSSSK